MAISQELLCILAPKIFLAINTRPALAGDWTESASMGKAGAPDGVEFGNGDDVSCRRLLAGYLRPIYGLQIAQVIAQFDPNKSPFNHNKALQVDLDQVGQAVQDECVVGKQRLSANNLQVREQVSQIDQSKDTEKQ